MSDEMRTKDEFGEHPVDDLSLYALGLLEPRERASIERHLATCASCRVELLAHEATVARLAEGAARDAPRALRDRIVTRHARTPWSALARPAFVASLVLAIAMGALVVRTQYDLGQERALRDEYARALTAVAEGARIVRLEGTHEDMQGSVVVPRSGTAYLVLRMPDPPAGMTYQAWVIRDGSAHAAGLAPAHGGVMTMPLSMDVQSGDVAAITIERATGVDAPTSDPVLAAGL